MSATPEKARKSSNSHYEPSLKTSLFRGRTSKPPRRTSPRLSPTVGSRRHAVPLEVFVFRADSFSRFKNEREKGPTPGASEDSEDPTVGNEAQASGTHEEASGFSLRKAGLF